MTTYKIEGVGTRRMPSEPLPTDVDSELALIYRKAPSPYHLTYQHEAWWGRRLEALGGTLDIREEAGELRQVWIFTDDVAHKAAVAEIAAARVEQSGAVKWSLETTRVLVPPGLSTIGAERWRLFRTKAMRDVLGRHVVQVGTISRGKSGRVLSLASGIDEARLVHMIRGDTYRHSSAASGTGNKATLKLLVELAKMPEVAQAALSQLEIVSRKLGRAA